MLQFSILDTTPLDDQCFVQNKDFMTANSFPTENEISLENNSGVRPTKPDFQIGIPPNIISSNEEKQESLKSQKIATSESSIKTQMLHDTNGQTTPKPTLAHSFLLGDINCDIMKVIVIFS